MERIKREIFESACFDQIRKQHQDFWGFIESKIEGIEGDIVITSYFFIFKLIG